MARALAAAIVVSLLAVSGAGGADAQTPKRVTTYGPPFPAFAKILTDGDFDVALFSFASPNLSRFDVVDVFGCDDPSNFTGYCQRLVARDLDQARRILNRDQRACVLNRADAQLARDVPVIPLFQPPLAVYVRSNVWGYVDRSPVFLWNAENWWLER